MLLSVLVQNERVLSGVWSHHALCPSFCVVTADTLIDHQSPWLWRRCFTFRPDHCQVRASLWWTALFRKWSSCAITFSLVMWSCSWLSVLATLCPFSFVLHGSSYTFLSSYFTQQKTRPSGEIQSPSMCMGWGDKLWKELETGHPGLVVLWAYRDACRKRKMAFQYPIPW